MANNHHPARDQVGLRALNDALKAAFDHPGGSGREPGSALASAAPDEHRSDTVEPDDSGEILEREPAEPSSPPVLAALFFKQSPIRLHPGEQRTITIHANPDQVPTGTPLQVDIDPGLSLSLRSDEFPEPGARGLCAIAGSIRARVTAAPGSRLTVTATAGAHRAQLEVVIVRHRASGWVREIARKDENQLIEAEFDPETGIVTVYEGRKEFRELERAARRGGYTKKRVAEYVPYRMLEVEAAANAVYAWAAQQILARRLPEERPTDPGRVRRRGPARTPGAAQPRAPQARHHQTRPAIRQPTAARRT
jgi:hypothetical protein